VDWSAARGSSWQAHATGRDASQEDRITPVAETIGDGAVHLTTFAKIDVSATATAVPTTKKSPLPPELHESGNWAFRILAILAKSRVQNTDMKPSGSLHPLPSQARGRATHQMAAVRILQPC
jgi:hypothetical protein